MITFRQRISLLTLAATGAMLCIMALSTLWVLQQLLIREVERDVSGFGERGVPRFPHAHAYEEYGQQQDRERQASSQWPLAWMLMTADHLVLYQSENWPEELPPVDFAIDHLTESLLQPPPRPPPFPGNRRHQPPPAHLHHEPFAPISLSREGGVLSGRIVAEFGSPRAHLVVVADLARANETLKTAALALGLSLPLLALLAAGLVFWLSGKLTRPLRNLLEATRNTDANTLNTRLTLQPEVQEIAELVSGYNRMLERLESSFLLAKRFSSDAAHELKTPLTVLQGQIEVALQESQPGSPEQQRIAILGEETSRLRQIVSRLLLLAQADSGKLSLSPVRVNINAVVDSLAQDLQDTNQEIRIDCDLGHEITAEADPLLLERILQNLLTNAIVHNRAGGSVHVKLRGNPDTFCLQVTNTGKAIPQEAASRIFERFFRAGNSTAPGSGLGLSLARECARAHGGELRLQENAEDAITFTLTLPLKPGRDS
jgi:two-component system heavy metal sensor histidine kinase CusS